MYFSQLAVLSLAGLALASPVAKRTAATIEADIATVSSDLTTFDNDINKFTGTALQALALLSAYETLNTAVTTTTTAVTSTGALDAADSATIYADVSSLSAKVVTTLSDAVAKYSVVESAGYASDVCSALSSLLTSTDAFYKALEGTIYSTYTSEVTALQSTVDADFATTISTYGC
ncbi:hydrophobic surface binding protein A-domain-containing protein [Coniella lustricola]|uniref:Hydrophobic surface binding protein A-domain-containing protein n=1 Tax=Coniella lustricola TaxID=2025994 RepID=A0A2T3A311_9PEZI|nr:hydrophobic surface binding protein A-domain-containing protein [Coniella lustricola]